MDTVTVWSPFSAPCLPLLSNGTFLSYLQFRLGSVTLEPRASDSYQLVLEHAVSTTHALREKIELLQEENHRLLNERQAALSRLEKCVNIKEEVEGELFGKFKVVLNEKKAKIRQLMEQNKSLRVQRTLPSSSATDEGDTLYGESRETDDEMAESTWSPKQPSSSHPTATSSLLGEGQEVVSPVKRRRRQTRKKGGEPETPQPSSTEDKKEESFQDLLMQI